MNKNSPWGIIDYTESTCHPEIKWVSTPSHGGIRVEKAWAKRNLTKECIEHATRNGSEYVWFEEDCSWALVAYECPEIEHGYDDDTHVLQLIQYYHIGYLLDRKLYDVIDVRLLHKQIETWQGQPRIQNEYKELLQRYVTYITA